MSAEPDGPAQQSVQATWFGDAEIRYDDTVLAPRAWTIAQVEWAVALQRELPDGPVLDLCSGAGHSGIALALRTGRRVVLVDASEPACAFARRNVHRAGLSGLIQIRCASMRRALAPDERFPLIVADPPYIPSAEVTAFREDPESAIDGGPDGLDLARSCLAVAAASLTSGGACLLQLRDRDQVETIAADLASDPQHGLAVTDAWFLERGALLLCRIAMEAAPRPHDRRPPGVRRLPAGDGRVK